MKRPRNRFELRALRFELGRWLFLNLFPRWALILALILSIGCLTWRELKAPFIQPSAQIYLRAPSGYHGTNNAMASLTTITPSITVTRPLFSFSGASWTAATKALVKVGAFASYTYDGGDGIYISGGTGVKKGHYIIASKDSDDQITLTASIKATDVADVSAAHGVAPFGVTVSAHLTTCDGGYLPWEDLEYHWDFGDVNNIRTFQRRHTLSGILEDVDPEHDQYGPIASYVYQRSGTYTITLTVRGWTGDTSYVTEQTTVQIVIGDWPTTQDYRRYFDSVNGDDGHDGYDPWGFNLSGAAYNNTTGVLTKVGGFASYVYDTATYENAQRSKNWIYLKTATGAGFTAGLYQILNRVSDDAVTLAAGIASENLTDVTSSDGPQQTIDAIGTYTGSFGFQHRRAMLAAGSTWENDAVSTSIGLAPDNSLHSYGPGERPILLRSYDTGISTRMVGTNDETTCTQICGIHVRNDSTNVNYVLKLYCGGGGMSDALIDDCKITGNSQSIQLGYTAGGNITRPLLWGGEISGQTTSAGMVLWTFHRWGAIVGTYKTDGYSPIGNTTEHHFYPGCVGDYGGLLRWIRCGLATGELSYCLNINVAHGAVDEIVTNYWLVTECDCMGTYHGVDLDVGGGEAGHADHVIVEGNSIHSGQLGTHDWFALSVNMAATFVLRRNVFYGPGSVRQYGDSTRIIKMLAYENKMYETEGSAWVVGDTGFVIGCRFEDNVIYYCGSVVANQGVVQFYTGSPDKWTITGNQFWGPNMSGTPFYNASTPVHVSLATWNTAFSATDIEEEPDWTNPGAGDFRPTGSSKPQNRGLHLALGLRI